MTFPLVRVSFRVRVLAAEFDKRGALAAFVACIYSLVEAFEMRILVVGAAGKTGREVVRQAAARGHAVTALAHHAPDADLSASADLHIGDARNARWLDSVMPGQDAVVDAIGTRRPFLSTTLETDAARALLAAMQRAGVRRIAAVSSLGVGDSIRHVNWFFRMLIPVFFRGVMPDKAGMETALQASNCDWLIVRPSGLTDGARTGQVRLLDPAKHEHGFQISRCDVAEYLLIALESGEPLRRTDNITVT